MNTDSENFAFMSKRDPNHEKFLYMMDELKSLSGYDVNKFTAVYPRPHLQNAATVKLLVSFISRPQTLEMRSPALKIRDLASPIPRGDNSPFSPLRFGNITPFPTENEKLLTFGDESESPAPSRTKKNIPSAFSINSNSRPGLDKRKLGSASPHRNTMLPADIPSLVLHEPQSMNSLNNIGQNQKNEPFNLLKSLLKVQPNPSDTSIVHNMNSPRKVRAVSTPRGSDLSPGKTRPRQVSFAESEAITRPKAKTVAQVSSVKKHRPEAMSVIIQDRLESEQKDSRFKDMTPRHEDQSPSRKESLHAIKHENIQDPVAQGNIANRLRRRSLKKAAAPEVFFPDISPISESRIHSKNTSRNGDLSALDESSPWNVSITQFPYFGARTDRTSFLKDFINESFGGTSNHGNYVQQMSNEASMVRFENVQKIRSSEIRKGFRKLVEKEASPNQTWEGRHTYMEIIMGSTKAEGDSSQLQQLQQSQRKLSKSSKRPSTKSTDEKKIVPTRPSSRAKSVKKVQWKEQFAGVDSLQEDFVTLTKEVKENESKLIMQVRDSKGKANLDSLLSLSRPEKRKTRGEVDAEVVKRVSKTYKQIIDNSHFRQYRGAKMTAN